MNGQSSAQSMLSEIIQGRRTCKILGDPNNPIVFSTDILQTNDEIVKTSIETAGFAPFHYDRAVDSVAEPWRVYTIAASDCRELARRLPDWFDLKPSNKLPAMLAACGCLVLVTWIPQFREAVEDSEDLTIEKKRQIDDEHLSATAAMVQNLLLMLTAAGLGTYWSSGGQLGSAEIYESLGIPASEKLAAAIFVEYPGGQGPVLERIAGKNHEKRSSPDRWSEYRSLR